jgi:hypothetical protein
MGVGALQAENSGSDGWYRRCLVRSSVDARRPLEQSKRILVILYVPGGRKSWQIDRRRVNAVFE